MVKKETEIIKYRTFDWKRLVEIISCIILPYIALGIVLALASLLPEYDFQSSIQTETKGYRSGFEFIGLILLIIIGWFFGFMIIVGAVFVICAIYLGLYEAYNYMYPEKKEWLIVCLCGSKSPEDTAYCPTCGVHLEEE